jgi:threonine dehydrogenase-like Zn-dependent dehydrogenase
VINGCAYLKRRMRVMKGFAMLGIGKVGWIEKDKPKAGLEDAIVRPLAVAPCTSDIHTVFEGALGEKSNIILGHEAVGEVVEVGSEVKDFKPGDRVVVPAITPDWKTIDIQRGFHQHSGGLLAGWKFSNIKDGVFGEYFHVNDADMNLAILPENIPLEAAAMFPDMVTTGFHGAELAEIGLGDTVAVLGIGPVGLMAVAGAKMRGASRLIVVGTRPNCVEVAKAYGATDVVNYKVAPVEDQILELTGGQGVDAVIIAGGNSDILVSAVKMVKPGGKIANINYFGEGETLPLPRLEWGSGMSHKAINGGLTPGGRLRMEKLVSLYEYGRIAPEKLVTHVFEGFEHIEEALMLMKDKPKDLIKPVVLI